MDVFVLCPDGGSVGQMERGALLLQHVCQPPRLAENLWSLTASDESPAPHSPAVKISLWYTGADTKS